MKLKLSDISIKRFMGVTSVASIVDDTSAMVFRYNKARTGGSFHLRHYQGGAERWALVARWPEVSTTKARAIYRDMKVSLYRDPKTLHLVSHFTTFGELLVWYKAKVKVMKVMSHSRKSSALSILDNHLTPRLGQMVIDGVTRHGIDKALITPLMENYKPSYVKQVLGVLKLATSSAEALHLLPADPLTGWSFKHFVTTPIEPRLPRLTATELDELKASIPVTGSDRALILLMIMWGTRVGETLALRWKWWDKKAKVIRIPAAHTKTKAPHVIPVTPQAEKVLMELKRFGTQVLAFPSKKKGSTLDESTAHKRIKAISGGDWTAHDLRKLFRTMLAELGCDYYVGERLLNHTLSGLDKVYNRSILDAQKVDALTKYHDHLEASGLLS